jgi:hypothetical protein
VSRKMETNERWLLYSRSEQFDSDLMLVEDFR